ncbi:MAG: hypothetical protein ABUT11_03970, partial [Leifsonia sp.]
DAGPLWVAIVRAVLLIAVISGATYLFAKGPLGTSFPVAGVILVVLAKWMFTDPELLILDEPTRGIDVGAKFEIYGIIQRLAAQGSGVLLISSELPELLGICDRIYTIFEGRITNDIPVGEADPETLMRSITTTQKKAATR